MPITSLITDGFEPEQRHVLELAFNAALRRIGLVDRKDPICDIVAQRMIAVHRRGVTEAVTLCEITIREIGVPTE
ncbi:hypothetical protein ABIG06_000491 [Bradyrhizobium sp. USDA 326]|uniref:hypothetical protein n=1 Tax=unclassified Bradyrhizobium TaxID=2631580 RepID=UPI0035142D8F